MGSFSSKYLKDIWNLPNILTMLRLVLIPVFAGLFLAGYEKWALAVFIIASITDYLDGYLARKNNQITAFGKLMDPLADKLMVCTALLGQGLSGVFPWPAILIVMTKEVVMIIGGIYMLAKGVIRIRIPAAYIITVAVLTLVFSRAPEDVNRVTWMLYEIFGGGLFLGAFFMATDYVTSPNTPKGEVIFGIGAGLLVVFIRYFGGYPEGVCYSILIMNICVWLIDKATLPHRFGVSAEMRKAEKEKAKAAKKAAKEGA